MVHARTKDTMVSFDEATKILDSASNQLHATLHLEEEHVTLEWAVDRIAKRSYHSPCSTPAYDTSAMDGFALCSRLTANASPESPVTFCVNPDISRAGGDFLVLSGDEVGGCCDCGTPRAVEIMTGGRFPSVAGSTDGAEFDCCVRLEDIVPAKYSCACRHIQVSKPAHSGQNRRLAAMRWPGTVSGSAGADG